MLILSSMFFYLFPDSQFKVIDIYLALGLWLTPNFILFQNILFPLFLSQLCSSRRSEQQVVELLFSGPELQGLTRAH